MELSITAWHTNNEVFEKSDQVHSFDSLLNLRALRASVVKTRFSKQKIRSIPNVC